MEKQRSEKYAENEKEEDTRSNRGVCWETEERRGVWWSARPAVTLGARDNLNTSSQVLQAGSQWQGVSMDEFW